MIVLIDDDKLIHASWKIQAKAKNILLHCFISITDFINASNNIPLDVTIYIDSELGSSIKGELASKVLHEMGYRNIVLCTGHIDIEISGYPWISGKINKRPPF